MHDTIAFSGGFRYNPADKVTLAVIAEEGPAYLKSRGLDPDVILEPAIRSKLGLDQLTADHDGIGKTVQIHEQNQRSRHAAYLKGVVPSPAINADAYDADAQ
jgi:hypothetical protein